MEVLWITNFLKGHMLPGKYLTINMVNSVLSMLTSSVYSYLHRPHREPVRNFRFTYRLPQNIVGEQVLLQWRYVTANSCIPRGYRDGAIRDALTHLRWVIEWSLPDCAPLNETGKVDNNNPEQFWNCAEITIRGQEDGGGPRPAPTPPRPTQPYPTPPTGGEPTTGTCGGGNRGNGMCRDSSMCCSTYGWCGASAAHCAGGAPSPTPPVAGTCGGGNRGNGVRMDSSMCCSMYGWCGTSAAHCSPDSAPGPSPTPPVVGTCGGGNRGNGVCRDTNLCCSQWGWCGSSSGHCGGRRGLRASNRGEE